MRRPPHRPTTALPLRSLPKLPPLRFFAGFFPSPGVPARQSGVQLSVILLAAAAGHRHAAMHWLLHFGVAGLFVVALLDAAPVPLPIPGSTDILVLILAAHGEALWLLAPMAIAGSLIGGYLTWGTGKKGGEAMLDRYVPPRFRSRIRTWVKRHGILSVCLAAMLPPPIPLMPFLLAAGVLGVGRRQVLIALGIARTVRYGGEAVLGLYYGRPILRALNRYLSAGWSTGILCAFLALLAAAIVFAIWKYRHEQRREAPAAAKVA
jgi:membrane protein YqaA with SNARE-associated domain